MTPTGWAHYQELRDQVNEPAAITTDQVPAIVSAQPVQLFPNEGPARDTGGSLVFISMRRQACLLDRIPHRRGRRIVVVLLHGSGTRMKRGTSVAHVAELARVRILILALALISMKE
jgi:hypothetical protein